MSRPNSGGHDLTTAVHLLSGSEWDEYAAAVTRWEIVSGRPAPLAVIAGERGGKRLNPKFSEWMMGIPAGRVTAAPGLDVHEQHKAIGNGVVWLQAAYAVGTLMRVIAAHARRGAVPA